jgi:hypothetical protein
MCVSTLLSEMQPWFSLYDRPVPGSQESEVFICLEHGYLRCFSVVYTAESKVLFFLPEDQH